MVRTTITRKPKAAAVPEPAPRRGRPPKVKEAEAPAKKAPASKTKKAVVAAPEPAAPVVKKGARKTAAAPETEPAAKRAAKKAAPVRSAEKVFGPAMVELSERTGFPVGSDRLAAVEAALAGGFDRRAVLDKIRAEVGDTTRNDTTKQVSNLLAGVLRILEPLGWTVESSWILKPPPVAAKKTSARKK